MPVSRAQVAVLTHRIRIATLAMADRDRQPPPWRPGAATDEDITTLYYRLAEMLVHTDATAHAAYGFMGGHAGLPHAYGNHASTYVGMLGKTLRLPPRDRQARARHTAGTVARYTADAAGRLRAAVQALAHYDHPPYQTALTQALAQLLHATGAVAAMVAAEARDTAPAAPPREALQALAQQVAQVFERLGAPR